MAELQILNLLTLQTLNPDPSPYDLHLRPRLTLYLTQSALNPEPLGFKGSS